MTTDALSQVPDQAASRAVAAKSGAIILARHGEPALSRKILLTSQGYRDWWARYEEGGLLEGQVPPDCLIDTASNAGAIFSSTRQRSRETAAAVAGGAQVHADVLFIEAPLPPPDFPAWFKLSPRWWGVVARAWWWFFDHHEGQETKAQAQVRAAKAADMLERRAAEGKDVLVLAHGFFNGMVGVELAKRGWRCVRDRGFKYWSARHFEKV
jgi:broad specificity phosphatase PhoE